MAQRSFKIFFAEQFLAISADGRLASAIVDLLFENIPRFDHSVECSEFVLRDIGPDCCTLVKDGESLIEGDASAGPNVGECATAFLSAVTHSICEHCSSGLLLHGAAVNYRDTFLLFPGASGAGKTSTVVHLIQNGAAYLSDELIYVDNSSRRISCLARPLNIKDGRFGGLGASLESEFLDASYVVTSGGVFVRPDHFGGRVSPLSEFLDGPGAIIFPRFCPDDEPELKRSSAGYSYVKLLETLVNSRNLRKNGFEDLRKLVDRFPLWEFRFNQHTDLIRSIDHVVDQVDF